MTLIEYYAQTKKNPRCACQDPEFRIEMEIITIRIPRVIRAKNPSIFRQMAAHLNAREKKVKRYYAVCSVCGKKWFSSDNKGSLPRQLKASGLKVIK